MRTFVLVTIGLIAISIAIDAKGYGKYTDEERITIEKSNKIPRSWTLVDEPRGTLNFHSKIQQNKQNILDIVARFYNQRS
jgi:hypothetical protein